MECTAIRTEQRRRVPRWLLRLGVLVPLALASCRVTSQSVAQSQRVDDYDRLQVIYQAHSAEGPLFSPSRTTAHTNTPQSSIIPVSAQVPASADSVAETNWSMAELRIEYPHPDGRNGYARVTLCFKPVDCGCQCDRLTLEQRMEARQEIQRVRRETRRERWFGQCCSTPPNCTVQSELDLPRDELDSLLSELSDHGFFASDSSSTEAASRLEVRLNRRWTSKSWAYEPALDALTTRVYEEGRIRTVSDQDANGSARRWPWLPFRPNAQPQ